MDSSVIIPTYNRVEETDEAIESVLQQSCPVTEIIVIDDGSNTRYKPPKHQKIKLIRHDKNLGAAAARNSGIKTATGTWIAFLDSDDYWQKNKLEISNKYIENKPACAWTCGTITHDLLLNKKTKTIPKPGVEQKDFAGGCWHNPGSTLLIQRQQFDKIGYFNTSLKRLEDYEWFLRFSLAGGNLSVIPNLLVTINKKQRPTYDKLKDVDTILKPLLSKLNLKDQRLAHAYLSLEKASAHWYSKHYIIGLSYLLHSVYKKPRLKIQTT